MKAVVFAYNNIGCEGIEALLKNGFEISAVFTHKDDPMKISGSVPSRKSPRTTGSRSMRPKTRTIRSGSPASRR